MTKYYAQLNSENICVGIMQQPAPLTSQQITDHKLIEINFYDIDSEGKRYNNGKFEEVPEPRQTVISKHEFRKRLSFDEKAMLSDPNRFADTLGADGVTALKVLKDDLADAQEVDFDDEVFLQGIQMLVSTGILTQARANEIMGLADDA